MSGAHELALELDPIEVSDRRTVHAGSAGVDGTVADASVGPCPRRRLRSWRRRRLFSSTFELSECLGPLVCVSEFERDRFLYGRRDRDAVGGQFEIVEAMAVSDEFVSDARRQMRYSVGEVVPVVYSCQVAWVWCPDRHCHRPMGEVERPQLLRAVGVVAAQHYPVWAGFGMPQPDIDHTVASIVVVPARPFLVGQRTALNFEGDLAAVDEYDTDIGTTLTLGQPCLHADLDDIRLCACPSSEGRFTVEVPDRFRVMFPAGRGVSRWVSEVRTTLSGHSCADHDGHPAAGLAIAEGTHQCAVPGQALTFERTHSSIGRIRRCGHVLFARQIERDHESVGTTHPKTPCRIDDRPSRGHGKAMVAALFEEFRGSAEFEVEEPVAAEISIRGMHRRANLRGDRLCCAAYDPR